MRAFALAVLLAPALALGAVAQDKPAAPAPTPQTEQQATPPATPPAAATEQASKSLVLTEAQAKEWVGKPVYSNEGKKIGEVVAFARGADDVVAEMHADIGGFLGLGETRVKLTADQFELKSDRVIIDMTSAQAKDLPKVE